MTDFYDLPICDCIRPIIEKYVSIRNDAMVADEADNPGKRGVTVYHKKANAALKQNEGKYLIELLEAEHEGDCPAYREILGNVDKSRQKLLSEKKRLPKSTFDQEIRERASQWQQQTSRWEARLIKSTAALNEVSAKAYWIYLNSVEHLHMYEWPEGHPLNGMGLGTSHEKGHYITFKGKEYPFPYYPNNLFHQFDYLEKTLKQENLGATDLQEMPSYFFEETELSHYPEHAKLVYNIIEEIALLYADRYHKGSKDRVINDFLKHCEERALQVKAIEETPALPAKKKLKIDQIALYHAYMGLPVTRENGDEIAAKHGHTSGEKLFQRYTYYNSTANRKGRPGPCTPKKLENKIRLLQSVADILPDATKRRALDEIEILKAIQREEY